MEDRVAVNVTGERRGQRALAWKTSPATRRKARARDAIPGSSE